MSSSYRFIFSKELNPEMLDISDYWGVPDFTPEGNDYYLVEIDSPKHIHWYKHPKKFTYPTTMDTFFWIPPHEVPEEYLLMITLLMQ